MEIIVINLDRAKERMTFQCRQLGRLGLHFSRLSAECASHSANFEKYQHSWQRPLSHFEVSLFFNHKKIGERVVSENTLILILEDDAYLADETRELLKIIESLKGIDCLSIEARGNQQKKLLAKNADYCLEQSALFRLYQGRSGTGSYVLRPTATKNY